MRNFIVLQSCLGSTKVLNVSYLNWLVRNWLSGWSCANK
jgi:hypothetical protein